MAEVNPIDAAKLSDRELLLILHERVGTLSRDVHELKDGTAAKLAMLEAKVEHLQEVKAEKVAVDGAFEKLTQGNESRSKQINTINLRLAFFGGGLAVLQVVLAIVMKYGLPR